MDNQRTYRLRELTFLFIFPVIILYYCIYPDSIFHAQLLIFTAIVFFLGLDIRMREANFDTISFILLSLLLLLLFSSTIFSINRISSVPYFFSYIMIFVVSFTFKEQKKQLLILATIFGTLIVGLISSIYTLFHILSINIPSFLNFLDTAHNLIIPFFGQAFYSAFLILTFPFIIEKLGGVKRLLWSLIFFAYCLFLLMSFSRLAIFIFFIQIFCFLLSIKNKILKNILLFGLVFIFFIGAILILFVLPGSPWLKSKIIKQSLTPRIDYVNQGIQAVKESSLHQLLLGFGQDTFYEISNKYQITSGHWSRTAHNFYLQFFLENGLLASLILFIFLVYMIYNKFHKYKFAEKMSIFSLLLYSLASPANLNLFPVLLIFFVLMNKKEIKKDKIKKLSMKPQILLVGLILVLVFYWTKYLYSYTVFYLNNKPDLSMIEDFPYEWSFWNILIDNKKNQADELVKINNKLKQYSSSNIEFRSMIINNLYQNKNYCTVLELAPDYLLEVPYDIVVQNQLMDSMNNCSDKSGDLSDRFKLLKSGFENKDEDITILRDLFYSILRRITLIKGKWKNTDFGSIRPGRISW